MQKIAVLAVALGVLGASAEASADRGGRFGAGLVLGDPSGLSAQLKLGGPGKGSALNFAIGLELLDEQDLYIHVDYIVLPGELHRGASVTIPFYLGIGGFFADRGNDVFGVRAPFGLQFEFRTAPIHLFAELALFLRVIDDVELDVGGAVGFRYFF